MDGLSTKRPIQENEDILKALMKQIYYKRTDAIEAMIDENLSPSFNFIGLVNLEKKNTCKPVFNSPPPLHDAQLFGNARIFPRESKSRSPSSIKCTKTVLKSLEKIERESG